MRTRDDRLAVVTPAQEIFLEQTRFLNGLLCEKGGYAFKELIMPDGEIQRWWSGNGESVILKYKDDRRNAHG